MAAEDLEILLLGGFGRSGLGAINQMLAPHPEVFATPYEQRLVTDPDGLLSLESALTDNWTPWQADFAIARFRALTRNLAGKWTGTYVTSAYRERFGADYERAVDRFLDRLVSFSYRGVWAGRATLPNKALLRATRPRRFRFNTATIHFAPERTKEEFREASRELVADIYRGVAAGKRRIVVNEPFVSQSPARCLQVTGAARLVVVTRDPRDSFGSFHTRDWSPQELAQAVEFQRGAQQRWLRQRNALPPDVFLELKLEDLAADHAAVIRRLEAFLGIEIPPDVVAASRFSPERAHVGRWKKQFSAAEREMVNGAFAEILREYGYE